jgi:inhibitor of KinA sporulation pathway (predicted exonuclease)
MAWALYKRPERDPVVRLWHKALRQLARRKVDCAPWETPLDLARRLREQDPELADAFQPVVDAYLLARYGKSDQHLKTLRDAIAQLR